MKNIGLLTSTIFLSNFSIGQTCPDFSLGTKTPYKTQQIKTWTPPNNFTAVFINHVGRHGARHLTKDVNASLAYHLIMKADGLNALTEAGKHLQQKVLLLEKIEKKDFKSISKLGKIEQEKIAKRMLANNSTVFKNQGKTEIKVTKEIRTVQSADAFLAGIRNEVNTENLIKKVDDTALRFYDLSPAYLAFDEDGKWKPFFTKLLELEKYATLRDRVCSRFFTPAFLRNLSNEDIEDFTSDLYGFVVIINSIEEEIKDAGLTLEQVNPGSFFTCPELQVLSKINEAEDFLQKGPGIDVNGIQIKIAAPLLGDFIKTTDEYIRTKAVNVMLRFTHAEAVAPFATLLDFRNAAKPATSIADIGKVWSAASIVPLSANIQWILYKKNDSEVYMVKFLLNEKETAINGLKTKNFPFYHWKEVRRYYMEKLKTLHAELNGDNFAFLQSVK